MTRLARLLEAVAAGVALILVALLASGGWTVGDLSLTRADEIVIALAVIVGLRALVAPLCLPLPSSPRVVAVGALVYALGMGFIVVTRHRALRTHALDLGQYLQVIWSIAEGYGPYTTLPPVHFWGEHLSVVFYALAPLVWLGPDAVTLLVAQTVILAAGAFAVFGLARHRLGAAPAAAALTLLYLVNPSLHGINLRDIHPQAFVIPLIIAAALTFETRRYVWCAVALVATLACREDAAVAVVGFGVWLGVGRGRWRLGAAVAAASLLLLAVDIKYVMPYFRGEPYPHLHRYAYLGSSMPEIVLSAVVRPQRWLGVVLDGGKLVYLLLMLLPLGGLPLLAPRVLISVLPGLAMNLLSVDPPLFNFRSQYQSFVLPFLVLAAVEGYARVRDWRRAPAVLAVGLFASVLLTARTVNDFTVTRWRLGPSQHAAHALMRQIPADAAVSTNERLVPHLATRRAVFIYPTGASVSDWVLELEVVLATRPASGHLEVQRAGGWVLLRRVSAGDQTAPAARPRM